MLRLDLVRLDREGTVSVEGRIPADDPMWEKLGVSLKDPAEVRARASLAGTGEVVVRGDVATGFVQECRRCLETVPGTLSAEVTMVFVPSDSPGAEDDGDARVFDARASELELIEPMREEVVLAIDPYVVCDPKCKGLCPRCGVNRNTDTCECAEEEIDPRWDALRALQKE
jgi:uncharacterized protein